MPSTRFPLWHTTAISAVVLTGLVAFFFRKETEPDVREYERSAHLYPQPESHPTSPIDLIKRKAHTVYPSIPSECLIVATKRVQYRWERPRSRLWVAAIFHTNWKAECVLGTRPFSSSTGALMELSRLLDDKALDKYTGGICSSHSKGESYEAKKYKIKRLARMMSRTKRAAWNRPRTSELDLWAGSLRTRSSRAFVTPAMLIAGPFIGNTRVAALERPKSGLTWENCDAEMREEEVD